MSSSSSDGTEARFAARAADVVQRRGKDITFGEGSAEEIIVLRAIPDENPDQFTKVSGLDAATLGTGRLGLFFIGEASFERMPKGEPFSFDGALWSVHAVKRHEGLRVLVAHTGANPGESFFP